jgi:hypothetical protein
MLVAVVLGMIVTFAAGWTLANILGANDGRAGSTAMRPAAAVTSESGTDPLPTDLPTGPATGAAGSGQLQGSAAQNAVLPPATKATKAPIGRFDCPTATVRVSTAAQLTTALAAARPGTVIGLADGIYQGTFVAARSGTAAEPIYLCGARGAVLDGGSIKHGYGLHLNGVSHWLVSGFTVQNGQKGVMLDGATAVGLQDLLVQQIGDEAVHLRRGSSDDVVRGLTIRQTGLRRDKFGEGIYVGTAKSNWCDITSCAPDHSNGNFLLGNTLSATAAEAIDIKEGTTGGVVAGNHFDGTGMTGADSWVDVKGNGWLIADNIGTRAPIDGYQVHEMLGGWGELNLFNANASTVDASGYAIHVTKTHSGNVVQCNNTAIGAQQGLTNIACG